MSINPRIIVNLDKLSHNLQAIREILQPRNIDFAVVTKVFCADKRIVSMLRESGVDFFADSRLANLQAIGEGPRRLLLRVAMLSEAERVVANSELSLQSEISVIRALGEAADRLKRRHGVVLMVDMGDLREGIFYRDRESILRTARAALDYEYLSLEGVGVNLTCYGAIVPDEHNLGGLVDIARWLRQELGVPLPLVSGGNSSSLGLISRGEAPEGITNLRLGEVLALGNDTAACCLMPGFCGDAFTLCAELVEVQRKPSKPIGVSGANAFGESVRYEDRGWQRRGILAIGRQDIHAETLHPLDERVEILGASSDHLLVNLTQAPEYEVGAEIRFNLDYGNLLHAFTSAYVAREYVGKEEG